MSVNGYDVDLEREHRDLLDREREHDAHAWCGVFCGRGCRGPEPCDHVRHLVDGIRSWQR